MTMVVVHHSNGNSYCMCIHVSVTPHSPAHHLVLHGQAAFLAQGIIASIVAIIYSLSGYINHCDITDHITLC